MPPITYVCARIDSQVFGLSQSPKCLGHTKFVGSLARNLTRMERASLANAIMQIEDGGERPLGRCILFREFDPMLPVRYFSVKKLSSPEQAYLA